MAKIVMIFEDTIDGNVSVQTEIHGEISPDSHAAQLADRVGLFVEHIATILQNPEAAAILKEAVMPPSSIIAMSKGIQ